jgi:acyl-coenzyme A thioesterase PaaI-like protein
MTDLPVDTASLPGRLGATARIEDDELVIDLAPEPSLLHRGVVRTSVLSYLVDCVAGIPLDVGSESWTLTTDMTVRGRPIPAPECITARFRLLREGRRSATGAVDLVDQDGGTVGTGAIGFARIPRKEGDPPKPQPTIEQLVELFGSQPAVAEPLREAAGIVAIDPEAGLVEVPLSDALRNPAGTLQGAMVALVAEAAAEDVLSTRAGRPVFVTDLDLRYLDKTAAGPVRTRTQVIGEGVEAAVVVELVDASTDLVTTLVHARATPVA